MSTVAQPLFITPHAVRRYRERVRPGLGEYEAITEILCALQGRLPSGALTGPTAASDAAERWVAVLEPPPAGKEWPSVSTVYVWRMFWWREDGRARLRRVHYAPGLTPPAGWLQELREREARKAAWAA